MARYENERLAVLGGRVDPITFSYGFLEAPLASVSSVYVNWLKTLGKSPKSKSLEAPLESMFHTLTPLTAPPTKSLLIATSSNWTAYFNNSALGSDAFPPVGYLALLLKCRGVVVENSPQTRKARNMSYGAVGFSVLAPENREFLNVERCVLAMNDGGPWKFFTRGEPLAFEDTACYLKKRVSDRLTPKMLQFYCAAMGISVFDDDFYQPSGVVIDLKTKLQRASPRRSLAEARKHCGLPELTDKSDVLAKSSSWGSLLNYFRP